MMGFPVAQLALLWIITMTIQCGNGQTIITNHVPTKVTYETATAHTGIGDVDRNSAHGSYREIYIDGNDLVVGEKNRVAVYSTGALAFQSEKEFPLYDGPFGGTCALLNSGDDDFVCQNYITTINEHNKKWYYCGTSGFLPQCWKCDERACTSGEVQFATGDRDDQNLISRSPYLDHQPLLFYDDPTGDDRIYGGDLMIIQGGTIASDGTFPAFISGSGPFPETKISSWTNVPEYVSDPIHFTNTDGEDVVYYFFNEKALEYQNVDTRIFPRVARICRDDGGSKFNNDQFSFFSTFLKARLNCSTPAFNGVPESGYDYLRDVYQSSVDSNLLFMVFSDVPNPTSKHANSAVCVTQLNIIDFIFKNSKFKGQGATFYSTKTTDSIWEPPADADVASQPTRPGTCPSIDTTGEHDFQEFITDYVLLNSTIPFLQVYPRPADPPLDADRIHLDQSQPPVMLLDGIYVTEMVVQENICGHTVFFLGTVDGKVYKAYTYGLNTPSNTATPVTRIVEEIDLTTGAAAANDDHEVLSMEIQINPDDDANTVDTVIFVGTTSSLHRIPVQHCSTYTTYRECIIGQDPYCTWSGSACIATCEGCTTILTSARCTDQCLNPDPKSCIPANWPSPTPELFNPTQDENFAGKKKYDRIENAVPGTEDNVQIDMWVQSEETAVWGETTYACDTCGCPPVDFKETKGVRSFADASGEVKAFLIGVYTFDLSACGSDVDIDFTFNTNSNTLVEMVKVVFDSTALETDPTERVKANDADKELYAYDYQASWWRRNKAESRNAESAVCYNCPRT